MYPFTGLGIDNVWKDVLVCSEGISFNLYFVLGNKLNSKLSQYASTVEEVLPSKPPANNAYSPTDAPARYDLAGLNTVEVLRVSDVLYASTVEE